MTVTRINGRFAKGHSGNPNGRPVGSKNKVTILQTALQEGFAEANYDKIEQILNNVVKEALKGSATAIKMVWEATVAKPTLREEKGDPNNAPQIIIKHMEVRKGKKDIKLKLEELDDE